jgi:hypothetical protein
MTLSLKSGGPVVAGRGPGRGVVIRQGGGRRLGMAGWGAAVVDGRAGGCKPAVAAGNVFGESSSEDEAA